MARKSPRKDSVPPVSRSVGGVDLKIVRVPLNSLHADPANARQHGARNLAAIRAALEEFGQVEPLIVMADNRRVIGGNGRLAVMRELGWKDVGVVLFSGSETQARALAIALNRTSELAEWNGDVLQQTLAALKVDGFDIEKLTITDDELSALVSEATTIVEQSAPTSQASTKKTKIVQFEARAAADDEQAVALIDKAEALAKKWKTAVGQLWEIRSLTNAPARHRLLIGDCTKPDEVFRLFEDGTQAHLMNTDPPYGIDLAGLKGAMDGFNTIESTGGIANDDLVESDKLQAFLESSIRTALPHLVENPAFYLWHPMLTQGTFFAAAANILIHRQIIWVKPHLVLTRSGMYHWKHELCFYGWIRGKPPQWHGDKSQTSVWECGEPSHGRLHPSQKPVDLFVPPIINHTKIGDVVYEPFAGSGSQLVAAEMTQRTCYALELTPKFAAVVLERLSAVGCKPKLLATPAKNPRPKAS